MVPDDKAGVSPAGGTAMRFMQKFLMGLSLCVLLGGPAGAATMTWTLNGVTFADGGTAIGTFGYDASTNTYSAISIITPGGIMTGSIYGVVDPPPSSTTSMQVAFINLANAGALPDHTGAHRLLLYFTSPLTNAGGTISLGTSIGSNSSEGICQTAICLPPPTGPNIRFVTGGSVSASPIPIPTAAWLFGSALGLMGWMRRKVSA